MKIPPKVTKFLVKNKIKYEIISHKTVYTAYDKAATLKVKLKIIGKTLVLKTNRGLVMVLIPGSKNLDKNKFKKAGKFKKADFISETVMKNKFKGFKIGAVPPFGALFKIPAFVDRGLQKEKNILVSSGIYESSIKISPKVAEKLGLIKGNFAKAK